MAASVGNTTVEQPFHSFRSLGRTSRMPSLPAYQLKTDRLRLVPCDDEHLEGLSALNSDPEVMRFISGRPETRSETQHMIDRVKARWTRYGYSWWSFIELASDQIVGAGCIQNLRRTGADPDLSCPLEIGWRRFCFWPTARSNSLRCLPSREQCFDGRDGQVRYALSGHRRLVCAKARELRD